MQIKISKEEAIKKAVINDYRQAVKFDTDIIGLMGNQPTLRKIRESYLAGEIAAFELEIVLEALFAKTGGEEEPYKNAKEFYKQMFPHKLEVEEVETKSVSEQVAAIKNIFKDDKKFAKKKSAPKPKKQVTIDMSKIPEHLRKMFK